MALQSSALLASLLGAKPVGFDERHAREVQKRYAHACRAAFARRLYLAQLYAQIAMHGPLAAPAAALMRSWPSTLTRAATLAGKTHTGMLTGRPAH